MIKLTPALKKHLKGFIFPQVDIDEWIKLHNMNLSPIACDKCDNILRPLIPIASKLDRGVVFEPCSCGETPPVTLVAACPKQRQSDIDFFNLLKNNLK